MKTTVDRIEIDPKKLGSKPNIRGMRISLETVMEYLAAGETKEEILRHYPFLKPEDIDACLKYALKAVEGTHIFTETV